MFQHSGLWRHEVWYVSTYVSEEQPPSLCCHKDEDSLIGITETFAFTCFRHYWPPAGGTANAMKAQNYV
jgi:hypothetical protein